MITYKRKKVNRPMATDKRIAKLTTADNPWDPFTSSEEWLMFDISVGYNTCERLDKLAKTSDLLPDSINNEEIDQAMDALIQIGAINRLGEFVDYLKIYIN